MEALRATGAGGTPTSVSIHEGMTDYTSPAASPGLLGGTGQPRA